MPPAPLDADIAGSAIKVANAFEHAHLPYAIGGAIALTMHGFVRATRDVDINVFFKPAELPAALEALVKAGIRFDVTTALNEANTEGWFSGWDGGVRIDVFVPSIEFAWEAFASRIQLSFVGQKLWFLSAESLCVFKLLFFRTKDLADLEQLVLTSESLDRAYVRRTIGILIGDDDERIRAWDAIVTRFVP